jgi:hypothetical protein
MALQHLRSSTADKRPTPAAMSDGQLALNTNLVSPGLFFKDSNGDSVKIGPVHVGTTAPNATPGAGGQAGNSKGEAWLDTTATNPILKVWNGSAFVAVQPVGTGTVVSTTDTGTVTSTMILDGTILNADINASAAIVDTKLATIATGGKVSNSATTATNANTASAIVARDGSGNFTAGTITAAVTGAASSNVLKAGDTMTGALVVPLASAATPSLTFTGDLNTGIFSPGADQVAVATNATERARIDASGRLLVGTSTSVTSSVSQQSLLQVYSTSSSASSIQIGNYTAGVNAAGLHFDKSRGATVGTNTVLQSGDNIGSIKFNGADGTNLVRAAGIDCAVDGTPGANDMPGRLVFSTTADGASTPTERMRIDSSGNVGIGDSSPSTRGRLSVISTAGVGRQFVVTTAGVSQMRFDNNAASINLELQNYGMTAANNGAVINWSLGNSLANANTAGSITVASEGIWGATSASRDSFMAFSTTLDGNVRERVRIDSSGRLLVGTSSVINVPNRASTAIAPFLQLAGSSGGGASAGIAAFFTDTSYAPMFTLAKSNNATVGSHTTVANATALGELNFAGSNGSVFLTAASITSFVDGVVSGGGANDMPGRLVFSTTADGASSPTERMRITSAGHVLLGTTSASPSSAPEPSRLVSLGDSSQAAAHFYTDLTSKVLIYFSRTAFGTTGSISISGTSTAYNTSSDYRLKENVTAVSDGITRLQQLKPSRFNFIADPDKTVDGFIAHEVQAVVPEAINGEKDAEDENGNPVMQGIDQSGTLPSLSVTPLTGLYSPSTTP